MKLEGLLWISLQEGGYVASSVSVGSRRLDEAIFERMIIGRKLRGKEAPEGHLPLVRITVERIDADD